MEIRAIDSGPAGGEAGMMKMKLEDRVAIVTGASRGIGHAVARAYADHGAKVALVSRNLQDLDRVVSERTTGQEMLPIQADVGKEEDVSRFVSQVMNHFGKIDILVNNAGVLTRKAPLQEVTLEEWDLTLSVNLTGYFLCAKHVLPIMQKRKSGVILFVSSGAGKREAPEWGPYAVSKFGVEGLNLVVAAEARSYGIRVNAVNPGGVRTAMRNLAYPDENPMHLTSPEEVAPLFVYLASSEARHVTGQSVDFREWIQAHPEWKYGA